MLGREDEALPDADAGGDVPGNQIEGRTHNPAIDPVSPL